MNPTPALRIADERPAKKMARKLTFSVAALDKITAPAKGRTRVFDTRTPGLMFMVTPAGSRSFYLYRWHQNRPVMFRLGGYPEISIEQARDLAADANAKLAHNVNPMDERREIREATTWGELWTAYFEKHVKVKCRPSTAAEYQNLHDRHLEQWNSRPLSAITRAAVHALHARMAKTPYEANRTLALISAMFNHAKTLDYTGPNPAEGVKRYTEEKRRRFLQPGDEMRRFWEALEADPSEDARDLMKTLLLTGARKGNVMAMRWEQVDLDEARWTIPGKKAKGGEEIVIHLHPATVEILRHRLAAQQAGKPSEWVFPGRSAAGHFNDLSAAWERILARANLSGLRPHDLRRTLGSWQACLGASLPIIGASLGHKSTAATAIYARLADDPVKQSVHTAVEAMLAAAQPQPQPDAAPEATPKPTKGKKK